MAEVLVFQCQGYYDWQFEQDDNRPGQCKAQILLGGEVIWESAVGYYDEEQAQEQASQHLKNKLKELLQ